MATRFVAKEMRNAGGQPSFVLHSETTLPQHWLIKDLSLHCWSIGMLAIFQARPDNNNFAHLLTTLLCLLLDLNLSL